MSTHDLALLVAYAFPVFLALTATVVPRALEERHGLVFAGAVAAGTLVVLEAQEASAVVRVGALALRFDRGNGLVAAASAVVFLALSAGIPARELRRRSGVGTLGAWLAVSTLLLAETVATAVFGFVLVALAPAVFAHRRARNVALLIGIASSACLVGGLMVISEGDSALWSGALESLALASSPSVPPSFAGLGLVTLAVAMQLGVPPFQSAHLAQIEDRHLGAFLVPAVSMPGLVWVERVVAPSLAHASTEMPGAVVGVLLAAALLSGAMVLVQASLRRAVGWFLAAMHAVVLVAGLDPTPIGHVGGLAMWCTSALAMSGLSLAFWGVVARRGDVDLRTYGGFYRDAPLLATAFTLFGLACAGLPGTLDFVSEDLSLHGALAHHAGLLVMLVGAISLLGFAALFVSARVFLGPSTDARLPPLLARERVLFVALALCLVAGGLAPGRVVHELERGQELSGAAVVDHAVGGIVSAPRSFSH